MLQGACLGTIDGTHIPAHVPTDLRMRYRDRKNQVSQNVLAACSMNMEFLYILPGWEGSAADSRVFESAQSSDFIIPEGRYYLVMQTQIRYWFRIVGSGTI